MTDDDFSRAKYTERPPKQTNKQTHAHTQSKKGHLHTQKELRTFTLV